MQYRAGSAINAFVTYASSYKPVGINIGGLPTANGQTLLDLARVKPEYVNHIEFGLKTKPSPNSVLNLVFYNTDIKDFQTQVQTPEPGVNRGYLANAEKVRVMGVEVDGNIRVSQSINAERSRCLHGWQVRLLQECAGTARRNGWRTSLQRHFGGVLPGISKWSGSVGGEVTARGKLISLKGNYFLGIDAFYRSSFSSSPSPSQYLNIDGYSLVNGRLGFRASTGISIFIWGRNLFNTNYYEQLLGGSRKCRTLCWYCRRSTYIWCYVTVYFLTILKITPWYQTIFWFMVTLLRKNRTANRSS